MERFSFRKFQNGRDKNQKSRNESSEDIKLNACTTESKQSRKFCSYLVWLKNVLKINMSCNLEAENWIWCSTTPLNISMSWRKFSSRLHKMKIFQAQVNFKVPDCSSFLKKFNFKLILVSQFPLWHVERQEHENL